MDGEQAAGLTDVPRPEAAIVSVGNELLYGETVDTNAAWLGRLLTEWGIRVVRGFTVRDRVPEIQEAVEESMRVADIVLVSGGLGPTPDDVTKGAVAELLGLSLVVDPEVRETVRKRFRAAGYQEAPRLTEGQSEVVEGSLVLSNDHGTAPGMLLDHDGVSILLLPGVPREMRGIVTGPLRAAWQSRYGIGSDSVHHYVIHTTGIAEPRLAELVGESMERLPPAVLREVGLAFLPDESGVDLRLTVGEIDEVEAEAYFDEVERALDPVIGKWRFRAESGDIADAVSDELRRTGLTLAAAESCTGGLLSKRMTDRAGASDVFMCGVVAYADAVKVAWLGVSRDDLDRDGAVSETVACQMASGIADRVGADAGVGITGVAGPGGGTAEKPLGTVWIAVALEGNVQAWRSQFAGDRDSIRTRAAQTALAQLYRRLVVLASRA